MVINLNRMTATIPVKSFSTPQATIDETKVFISADDSTGILTVQATALDVNGQSLGRITWTDTIANSGLNFTAQNMLIYLNRAATQALIQAQLPKQ